MNSTTKPKPVARPQSVVDLGKPAPVASEPRDLRPKRSPRRLALMLAAVVAALVVLGLYLVPTSSPVPQVPTDTVNPIAVVGLGYVEPVTRIVRLGAPGNPDSQRLADLRVEEGQSVEEGQVLGILDNAEKLAAQVRAAEVLVDLKSIQLERQKLEIAASVTARRSSLERAWAELTMARAEFDRQKSLWDRKYAAQATYERKQRELTAAEATVREMEASLQRIEAQYARSDGTPAMPIDIAVTEKELASTKADLDVVRASYEQTLIRAPFAGRVLTVRTRPGERISNDGLLDLGATHTMRAVFEVYQTDIPRVRVGQSVTVKSDVLPSPISGTVERIGSSVKRQSVVNNDPATATDARVIDVFVAFDELNSQAIAELSNLQVYGVFAQ